MSPLMFWLDKIFSLLRRCGSLNKFSPKYNFSIWRPFFEAYSKTETKMFSEIFKQRFIMHQYSNEGQIVLDHLKGKKHWTAAMFLKIWKLVFFELLFAVKMVPFSTILLKNSNQNELIFLSLDFNQVLWIPYSTVSPLKFMFYSF